LDSPTRLKIDLCGDWHYAVEGGPSGTVKVPSAYDFTGKVRFDRTFEITPEQLEQYQFQLVMLGSNYATDVTINGDFVANHVGGYSSFAVPIPMNLLQIGRENAVQIRTDNTLDPRKTIPLRPSIGGWRNYGGILREVFILGIPKLFVKEVVARTELNPERTLAKLTVNAICEGTIDDSVATPVIGGKKAGGLGFYFEAYDKISSLLMGKSSVVPLDRTEGGWEEVKADLRLQDPKLWSPENPELYFVKCYIVLQKGKDVKVLDEFDLNVGVRKLQVVENRIMLNGKRFTVKGVTWEEDHPASGSAMTYEQLEKDVALIKNLGANVVRFGNHPPHPYMLNLCDRYGLMAMEEVPLTRIPGPVFLDEQYVDAAGMMVEEMVERDRNHPCVLAWGLGDDLEPSDVSTRDAVQAFVSRAKKLDDRPTYLSSGLHPGDVCSDLVDLATLNIYMHDLKAFRKQLEEWKQKHPKQPVILARFGMEVEQDNRNGYSDPLSYEAQARFYLQRFDVVKALDYTGAILWSFNDWKSDRPALSVNSGNPWIQTMGLVNYQREKRLAYDAVRSIFRGEKFVALPAGNYSARAPIIYVLAGLAVLIGVAYFYNANRRFRENINRSALNAYNFFADVRDQRSVSILQTSVLGIIVSIACAIVASSLLYHFRASVLLDTVLSYVMISDFLKEKLIYLIWDPSRFIVVASLVFLAGLCVLSGILLMLSPLFRVRIYPYHAYVTTIWATTPLLLLVPVGTILYRVMDSQVYVTPSLILIALVLIWIVIRFLKAISIIFDAHVIKVYAVGIVSLVAVAFLLYSYADHTQGLSMHLSFIYNVIRNYQ
jgi:hypothetical protein